MSKRGLRDSLVRGLIASLHSTLTEVGRSSLGKIALALVLFFIVVSIYALIALPRDIADRWNNIVSTPWIYYPKGAPPTWIKYFGYDEVDSMIAPLQSPERYIVVTEAHIQSNLPEYVKAIGVKGLKPVGYVEKYIVEYEHRSSKAPNDIILAFEPRPMSDLQGKTLVNIIFLIERPDGRVIEVLEEPPIPLTRLTPESPLKASDNKYCRVFLSDYEREFNITGVPAEDLCRLSIKAFFGSPKVVEGSLHFDTLKGRYKFILIVAYSIPGLRPDDVRAEIVRGNIGFKGMNLIVVGTVFGLLGTDLYGRDLTLGILFGFPVAIAIGFMAAVISVLIGLVVGVISGYYGGRVDEVIQRFIDLLNSIPILPILILIGYIVQDPKSPVFVSSGWGRLLLIITLIAILGWGGLAIVVRSMALSIKSEQYVEAAKAIGASSTRIIFRHIVPQIVPYAVAVLVLSVPGAVLTEAALNIIGIRHGLPTWGLILSDAFSARGSAYWMWWWILPPGILLALLSFTFVALGFTLETMVEPRLRRR